MRETTCMVEGVVWEISVPLPQFCCESKTASIKKEKKYLNS